MTTEYSLTDELPKDAGGAKLIALIDDSTSQSDFAMLKDIGAEPWGSASHNVAFLEVATHTAGSILSTKAGVMLVGAYTEAPTAVNTNNAQVARMDNEGALYVRQASAILSYSAASVETHVAGSALLHDLHIRFNDVDAGDTVTIEDGSDYRLMFVATAASQHFSEHFSGGLHFNTSLKHILTIGGGGGASVTLGYSAY